MGGYYDYAGWIPDCPEDVSHGHRASAAACFGLLAVASAVLAAVCALRYNSITLYERRVRTPGISNTLWTAFFGSLAVAAASDAVYMAAGVESAYAASIGEALSLSLRGAAVLLASLSLHHQLRYRSSPSSAIGEEPAMAAQDALPAQTGTLNSGSLQQVPSYSPSRTPPPTTAAPVIGSSSSRSMTDGVLSPSLLQARPSAKPSTAVASETDSLLKRTIPGTSRMSLLKPTITEGICLLLLVQYLVCVELWGSILHSEHWYYIVYLVSLALQLLPLPVMCVMVCAQRTSGPRRASKVALALGVVANILAAAPVQTWGFALPKNCFDQSFLSPFDLSVLATGGVTLTCYMIFITQEYERHKAECMFQIIRQNEPLNYRQFY